MWNATRSVLGLCSELRITPGQVPERMLKAGMRWGVVDAVAWRRRFPPEVWRAMLAERQDEVVQERIQSGSRSGIPLMDEGRLAVLERRIGRSLKQRPQGRPRKDRRPPS